MSLFTENLQVLVKYSKKIDRATATAADLANLETLKADFLRQKEAGYFNEKHREILTNIAAAELDEMREVISINEEVKEIGRQITADRRREAAANKADFITAYSYTYGSTRKHAETVYKNVVVKEGNTKYMSLIIEGYKQDGRKAFYND